MSEHEERFNSDLGSTWGQLLARLGVKYDPNRGATFDQVLAHLDAKHDDEYEGET